MIFNIPIENLEERYSKQWNVWFPREFQKHKIRHITIDGKIITTTINVGTFLDVCGTNYFKASQLQKIVLHCQKGGVQDGDIFFFHDLWFPGLEMLAYIRDGLGIDFKICGILHAGTYDKHDFLYKKGMSWWGKDLENSWFKIIDKIFVATHFHKRLLFEQREVEKEKICVTGLPIYPEFVHKTEKQNIVVFPHRLDEEKNPDKFDVIAKKIQPYLHHTNHAWKFIKTKDVCKTKQEYYNLLNKSKVVVSCADQETWGIAQQEGVMCGCIPVVPDRLSYQEMYPSWFRYRTEGGLIDLLYRITAFHNEFESAELLAKEFIWKGKKAIPNMIEIMSTL